MIRLADNPPKDILDAAIETYELERMAHDLDKEALEAAIFAAVRKYDQIVTLHNAELAENLANELAKEDNEVEGSLALRWFADRLRNQIPRMTMLSKYEPKEGDRVEVILIGDVDLEFTKCAKCGVEDNPDAWSVTTDEGHEYFFDLKETTGNLKVRIISREEN